MNTINNSKFYNVKIIDSNIYIVTTLNGGLTLEQILAQSIYWKVDCDNAGYRGVGSSGEYTANWWNASPNQDDSHINSSIGLNEIYDEHYTFQSGTFSYINGSNNFIFGKKTELDIAFNSGNTSSYSANEFNEVTNYTITDFTDTYTLGTTVFNGNTYDTITMNSIGGFGFYTSVNNQEFQVIEKSANHLYLRNVGSEGNAWYIRLVTVILDETPPVITITPVNGSTTITHPVGTQYNDAGATAIDNIDGPVTVVTDASNVLENVLGVYSVIYTATDAAGNSSSLSRTVNVVDTIPPVITLTGASSIDHIINFPYNDEGATANDNYDGDITNNIVVVNNVDVNTPGSYTVTYNVSDSSGNAATEVTRTVNVLYNQIPDAKFREKLINLSNISASDFDSNNLILLSKLNDITTLTLTSDGTPEDMINDMTGIRGFLNLTTLVSINGNFNIIDLTNPTLINIAVSVDLTELAPQMQIISDLIIPSDIVTNFGTLDTNGLYTPNGTTGIDTITVGNKTIIFVNESLQDELVKLYELPDLLNEKVGVTDVIDITGQFIDYEDDLVYLITISNPDVLSASLNGLNLSLNYQNPGSTSVTITAYNQSTSNNESVVDVFNVTVYSESDWNNINRPILNGDSIMNIELNSYYQDQGASYGDLSGTVDTSTLGTYYLTYTGTFEGVTLSTIRTVNVRNLFSTLETSINNLTTELNTLETIAVVQGWNLVITEVDGNLESADNNIVNGSVCQFINNKYEYSSSTYVTANKQYWVKCNTAGVLTLFNGVEILNSDNNPN